MKRFHFYMSILLSAVLFSLTACATEYNLATGREETLLYDTEKEVRIGDAVSQQMEKRYQMVSDVDLSRRVDKILEKIVAVCDRKDIVYSVRIVDEDDVNAVSLPGGYLYLFKGIIDRLKTDDQLAGVIAHEVGHITARHSIKKLQASYAAAVFQVLAAGTGNPEVAQGANVLFTTAFFSFSRQDEFEADRLAVKYTQNAGYDPNAMKSVLEVLQKEDGKSLKRINYFRTHPYINERIAALNKAIKGELEFRDYLNLTGYEDNY